MNKSLFRVLIFIIPISFGYLWFLYKDFFYFVLLFISFIFSILIVLPKLFSNKSIELNRIVNIKPQNNKTSHVKNKTKFSLIPWLLLFLISLIIYSFIFILIAIFGHNYNPNGKIVLSYLSEIYHYIYDFKFVGLIIFLIEIALFVYIGNRFIFKKNRNLLIKYLPLYFGLNLASFVSGLLAAFIILFVIAFLQLNLVAISSRLIPNLYGVIDNKKLITEKIKNMNTAPKIIPLDKKTSINSLFINTTNTFYSTFVISKIPTNILIPFNTPNSNYFMIQNKLVIKEINLDEMGAISPYLGKLLVKDYFKSRYIKQFPVVNVIGRQTYLDYRIKEINDELKEIDNYIDEIKNEVSTYYGYINTAKNNIAVLQSNIQSAISQKDSEYKNCISAGYYSYYLGRFFPYYNESYCRGLGGKWDTYINQQNSLIDQNNKNISYYQGQANLWSNNLETFQNMRKLKEDSKNDTPQELGIFESPDQIKIAIDQTSSNKVVDFLETLSHEYLHYSSYVNNEKTLLPFFEEGLTEYYARKVIKNHMNVDTHMGYPLFVSIIKQLIKKIPDKTMEDIYFNKNQSLLESILNSNYGENFYKNYELYFEIISYMPPREAISMANAIILKVGGTPLTEKDLYSSEDTTN